MPRYPFGWNLGTLIYVTTPLFITPLFAFVVTVSLHMLSMKVFPRLKLLDFPLRYGLSRPPLPYPTGILGVIVFCFFLPFAPFSSHTEAIIIAIVLLASVSFYDDRKPVHPLLRLSVHLGVSTFLIWQGVRISGVTNPLGGAGNFLGEGSSLYLTEGWGLVISIIFTFLWLGFTINALNWFDGVPGQVSILSIIAFLVIGCLSMSDRVGQPELALISFILAAIAAASALFDFPPPHAVLGDSGAMFFGLMIGILTIASGGKVATGFLVLGVPFLDAVFVVLRRLWRRESLTRGNRTDQHLHHRLLTIGWTPRQVILLNTVLGTTFGITALFLSTREKFAAAILLLVIMILLTVFTERRLSRQ